MSEKISEELISLIKYLNDRTLEYDEGHPTITDKEWDDKYFELICLEKDLGYTLSNSPTQKVIYEAVNSLKKVEHNHKMLSLEKTKDIEEIKSFVGTKAFIAMCKMDGLTCSLKYKNGHLVSAETRGNGIVGEDVLHNAAYIDTIPRTIRYQDELVVDGEIICTYKDFENFSSNYKNPRNFAAGSIRLLDPNECKNRKLTFVAWDVIKGFEDENSLSKRLNLISQLGFTTVPSMKSEYKDIPTLPQALMSIAQMLSYPIDGIVFKYDSISYGQSLGETSHHFKNAMAYKFYDEEYTSTLTDIEWTMGRTGILTPVAIFEPIDIDGTEVARASLHNISVMEELSGGFERIGDTVYIYKANQIIPQISKWEHNGEYDESTHLHLPATCPICGGETEIVQDNNSKVLYCKNPQCEGKLINRLDHFCGKKGLDIKGLSKATLEKLIVWGWVNNISDIMTLDSYRDEWIKKPGFGDKSVDKILNAIAAAKNTTLDAFISSLGIPLIGKSVSKELLKHISSYEEFRQKAESRFDFSTYDGFAASKTSAIWNYDFSEADKIYPYLSFTIVEDNTNNVNNCENLKVVITGKLTQFKNREALKEIIEAHGGKVVDSISKSTSFLINNDVESTSTKNQSAKRLGVPIISEAEFIAKYLTF